MTCKNALLIMAKRPTPGRTKTRLVPPLSPQQAAALYECFLRDTIHLVSQVPDVRPVLAYVPPGEQAYFAELAPDFECYQQEGPDLGARLDNGLTHYLGLGYRLVAAVNSDGPSLPLAYLNRKGISSSRVCSRMMLPSGAATTTLATPNSDMT